MVLFYKIISVCQVFLCLITTFYLCLVIHTVKCISFKPLILTLFPSPVTDEMEFVFHLLFFA
ncbi:MAG: hypothetical protein AB1349_04855, partial [Elusimicrobiota bacterium]